MNITLKRSKIVGLFTAVAASAFMVAAGTSEITQSKPGAEINAAAPDFTLTDVAGNEHKLAEYTKAGKVVVLEWFNPDCPVVQSRYNKFNGDTPPTVALEEEYADSVVWLRINSGAKDQPSTGKSRNEKAMADFGIDSPILLDASGKVGKLYGARVTPEIYLIDADGVLRYHGAIDNAQGRRSLGESYFLQSALQAVIAGETVKEAENNARGCGVKYGS